MSNGSNAPSPFFLYSQEKYNYILMVVRLIISFFMKTDSSIGSSSSSTTSACCLWPSLARKSALHSIQPSLSTCLIRHCHGLRIRIIQSSMSPPIGWSASLMRLIVFSESVSTLRLYHLISQAKVRPHFSAQSSAQLMLHIPILPVKPLTHSPLWLRLSPPFKPN